MWRNLFPRFDPNAIATMCLSDVTVEPGEEEVEGKSAGVRVIWISGAEANMSALGLARRTVTRFGAEIEEDGVSAILAMWLESASTVWKDDSSTAWRRNKCGLSSRE